MARTTINKNQLDHLDISNSDINPSAGISTSKLADGSKFIKKDGSVEFENSQSMGNYRITNLGAPQSANDAVRLVDLQNTQAGLSGKDAVRVATTANIVLSGVQSIDGVTLSAGDRILVKNQTNPATNGIYEVAAGAWSRTPDADTVEELRSGIYVFVQEGTINADSGWLLSTDGAITLGTTALNWTQFTGAGQINAGLGLTKNGNTIDVGTASAQRIVVNSDSIDLYAITTAATGVKISYDNYGRVTGSSALLAADLPTHTHSTANINVLTGYTLGTNATLLATDSLNTALGKLQGQVSARYTLPSGGSTSQYVNGLGNLVTFPTTMAPSPHTLDSHSNVTITSNTIGEILRWNGTAWVNNTLAEAGIIASLVTSTSTSGITNVATTNTNTYLNIVQSGSATGSSAQISGSNGITVSSNTSGLINISGVAYTGASGVMGMVPSRTGATTTRYLREDGTWVIPPNDNTLYTNGAGLNLNANEFSVNFGNTAGTVSEGNHNHSIDSLSNVTITSNTAGEILKWNGSVWVNNTLAEAGIQPLNNNLTNLSGINGTSAGGIYAATGTNTNALRTITGTASNIKVTNGDGKSGNPTIDLEPTTVAPGTYNNVTVDTYGRVTAGSNSGAAASDKYIVRETPTGTINGVNTVFTLANTPVAGKEMVFLNGQLLEPGATSDYTISGNTITILPPPPVVGDILRVTYFAQ